MVVVVYCFPFLEELGIIFSLDSQASGFGLTKLCSMGLLKIMVGGIDILLK
jgi:F-box/leucine-rich repeat protein 2/20